MSTIYDVARAAGVSPKTVSRVLNGDAAVREPTRETVREAISALGYVPSSAARAMRSNRSGLIGLITGAISDGQQDSGPAGLPEIVIVRGVQKALADAGLTVLIADTGGRQEAAPGLMHTFAEHRVEGVLFVSSYHQMVEPPPAPGLPVVLVNCHDNGASPAILPDEAALQRAVTARAIAAGHRRIAYLTLADGMAATPLRAQGYRAALAEAGLAPDPALVVEADVLEDDADRELAALSAALDRVLALPEPPTVLLCGNDRMAIRLYSMLRDRGLSVPADISVAGFDNYRLIAETLDPALSTVELPYARMGETAARLLVSMTRGSDTSAPPDPILVGGEVYWRDSVADLSAVP
jgi:LacI family transcriptional regulator